MELLTKTLALSAGGILGVNARYWLGAWITRWLGSSFPWATFFINVSGSFVIGLIAMTLTSMSPHSMLRLLLITGLLGGYTTFSTFTHESVTLWQRGEWALGLANLVGSVLAGCAAVILGAALASAVSRPLAPTSHLATSTEQHQNTSAYRDKSDQPPEQPAP
jgi:CrcB protein